MVFTFGNKAEYDNLFRVVTGGGGRGELVAVHAEAPTSS